MTTKAAIERLLPAWALFALLIALTGSALAEVAPHPGMLRSPDVSAESIVFLYADDLWLVPRDGGVAIPLASPPGPELRARFSPDGKSVAFTGNYDGDPEIYTLPVAGGVAPYRVTHHPGRETLADWTPDGKLMFYTAAFNRSRRIPRLYTVDPAGGLPQALPIPYGTKASLAADGRTLAYTPSNRDERSWKRYRGGMASDIWLFDLVEHTSRRATDWEGTDTEPMWHGGKLYYLSDAGPAHRRNVWVFDPASGRRQQITSFEDFDVRYAAIGPGDAGQGEIVLQNRDALYLLDLGTRKLREVNVRIPGARPTLRRRHVDASKFIYSWALSPSAKRAVVSARGDVWTLPREHGSPRNLTRSGGVAERRPEWSPDGKWIAFFSDASGEYELTLVPADGRGESRTLARGKATFYTSVTWAPDSKKLLVVDKAGALLLVTIEDGKFVEIDRDPQARTPSVSWSPDSRWIAYDRQGEGLTNASIWIYDVENRTRHQVTSATFNDSTPTFDRKGKYLFFASSRHFSPLYGELDTTFLYAGTEMLFVVPLKADQASPFAPKSDEEKADEGKEDKETAKKDAVKSAKKSKKNKQKGKSDGEEKKGGKDEKKIEVAIDFDGFERRAVALPVDPGVFGRLAVNDKGHLIYVRRGVRGSGHKPAIMIFDLEDDKREEKVVSKGAGGFDISADGKSLLVMRAGAAFIQKAAAKSDKEAKKVVTAGMDMWIDPRQEWPQIFNDAWRFERDYFYDPHMHGVDWSAMRERYGAMVADCVTRDDLSFVIRELIAELNVGHAYYFGGDSGIRSPRLRAGLLGADFELHQGAYRIAHIIEAAAWDVDGRGPLSQPGVDVAEGDYLLAVNGEPLDPSVDPWVPLIGKIGRAVTLTVSSKPTIDEDAREVVVEPIDLGEEMNLRYREWVEHNRAYVERNSGGRIGYIHVPSTGIGGQNELVRGFYSQLREDALIIDDRWNSGGQIPTRFIELLNRPRTNYWALRDGEDWVWPPDSHDGPKAMLINGLAGSGGDAFPWYFRQAGLGKLIGTRTWGGLVGISGNPPLIDGAAVTVPRFAFYEKDGTWGVEGHGVDPDIEVIDDPALMVDGGDPQLDRAIAELLEELERKPPRPVKRPPYPDRRGMGIPPADR